MIGIVFTWSASSVNVVVWSLFRHWWSNLSLDGFSLQRYINRCNECFTSTIYWMEKINSLSPKYWSSLVSSLIHVGFVTSLLVWTEWRWGTDGPVSCVWGGIQRGEGCSCKGSNGWWCRENRRSLWGIWNFKLFVAPSNSLWIFCNTIALDYIPCISLLLFTLVQAASEDGTLAFNFFNFSLFFINVEMHCATKESNIVHPFGTFPRGYNFVQVCKHRCSPNPRGMTRDVPWKHYNQRHFTIVSFVHIKAVSEAKSLCSTF